MATAPVASERRTLSLMVWIAFVIVLITDFGYVLLIRAQGSYPPEAFTVPFVAAYLALMATMLGVSMLDRSRVVRVRPALRAAAAAGLLVMGVLALMSVGILLVVAGAMATGAAVRSLAGLRGTAVISEVAAALVAIALLVGGFELTGRLIVCPSKGYMGGSGYALVTGGYHWTCVDGRLDYRQGFCSSSGGGIDANGHAFATNNC